MNFCPICGRDTKGTFCKEHRQVTFNYKDVVVRVCDCKKYFYRNRWVSFTSLKQVAEKIAKESIKDNVKITSLIDEKIEKKKFEIEVVKNNELFIIEGKLIVDRCPVCSKRGTPYFESVIQIRPKKKELYDFIKIQADKNKEVFITKIVELKDGYDFYTSSNKFALGIGKKLSKSFKGELKTSRRLFSFDKMKSKNLYRATVFFKANN
ncbi:MAG: 60S ribosomal export protein NMD3 [Nanoarchaeota archaeon]|nr:60S ribosomal export protein NMD3 [Nanoarchaeota archaeon]MBU1269516.1 60S ribosomal export protein NMD3 [Nanoarchaeota archaeon]MBU1604288.1 60S ribosomal export protein NMD3 [Nanoarchaeota archaeon]MBU2443672.1 60S ribosomal export protein NMD3 [Nanoarchaeota archaeon]